ncbi:ATP-dependent Clp protease ATP-binding subunit ClpA [Clostridium acetobutylicum]|nr:ATP-dependent Clp protease ATP-binding subunit ClpA [Clostridium acetobutylicum]
MDVDKLTLKVQQAINDCQTIAVRYNHQQIDTIHLFMAIISQEDGLIPNILGKMGADVETVKRDTEAELDRMPKVLGEGAQNASIYATRRFEEVFVRGEKISRDFKDLYISVEHVMLALMDIDSGAIKSILDKNNISKKEFLKALREVRGNQRVDTSDPEGTYDALNKYGRDLVKDAKKTQIRSSYR